DPVSIEIDSSQHEEQRGCGDADGENPFAAVRPKEKRSKGEARSHDADPRNEDIPDSERESRGDLYAAGRVKEVPQPVEASERSWTDAIEKIVGGDHAESQ